MFLYLSRSATFARLNFDEEVLVGQKTHPRGLRLGIIETWDSKWYNEKEYAQWLHEDLRIQSFIKERLSRAGISRIEIERVSDRCNIHIHTARPGIVIGRRGVEAEKLQADLERLLQADLGPRTERTVRINVTEIKRPELDAQLVAEAVALQIGRRSNFRQAMKKSIVASMKAGAQGLKSLSAVAFRVPKWHARNRILKVGCRCIRLERILIMGLLKPIPSMGR